MWSKRHFLIKQFNKKYFNSAVGITGGALLLTMAAAIAISNFGTVAPFGVGAFAQMTSSGLAGLDVGSTVASAIPVLGICIGGWFLVSPFMNRLLATVFLATATFGFYALLGGSLAATLAFTSSYTLASPKGFGTDVYSLLIVILPVVMGCLILIFGHLLGKAGTLFISVLTLGFCVFNSTSLLWRTNFGVSTSFFAQKSWRDASSATYWVGTNHNWAISIDTLTISMWVLVTLVAFLVIAFSFNYMLTDPHLIRFLAYLLLFTFFMIFLVSADSFTQFFFAWEGVGICSYLLIGFWSTRLQASKSAMKAVLVNKIGDVFLLFAIALMWTQLGAWRFSQVDLLTLPYSKQIPSAVASLDHTLVVNLITLCIIMAAVGKSAQIGLHTWLPDAMEGPTPVSALIHAATMVTAGIFLVLRSNALLGQASLLLTFVTIVGGLTALCSGLIACYQTDLKKIIAYSTCSQLGYMFFACGLTLYSAGLFHLISHGFFKALLFLVAGAYIHLYRNEQSVNSLSQFESRKLTNLYSLALYIGLLALSALPFFAGFYSKEPILLHASHELFNQFWLSEAVGYNMGLVAGLLTATYSALLLTDILQKNPKLRRYGSTAPFIVASTRIALSTLLVASLFFGFYCQSFFSALFADFFDSSEGSLFIKSTRLPAGTLDIFYATPSLPLLWELLPLIVSICFALVPASASDLLGWKNPTIYSRFYESKKIWVQCFDRLEWQAFSTLLKVLNNKFWVDYIYNKFLVFILQKGYTVLLQFVDKGFLEHTVAFNSVQISSRASLAVSGFHKNLLVEGFFFLTVFLLVNILLF